MDAGETLVPTKASTAERQWDTTRVAPHEQFAAWREVVSQAFVPVSVSRRDRGAFPSTVRSHRLGAISVSRIESEPQFVCRTELEIAADTGDVFFLNMPLNTVVSASQHNRRARLSPGDFVLIDGSQTFELEFAKRFEQISLAIPRETLSPLIGSPEDVTARSVSGRSGIGAVAAATIKAIARTSTGLSRHEARTLNDHVVGLVALAVGSVQSAPPATGRPLLVRAILDQIKQHHDDPCLSPEVVARRIGISVSYLHRLMTGHGTSFGRSLLAHRLQECRSDLEDPQRLHWKIAEIGVHHGFADPGYFARAFRQSYGLTPREHRRAALGDGHRIQGPSV